MKPHILFVVNVEWYFVSHRLGLARALRDRGCEVTVTGAVERSQQRFIEAHGLRFIPLNINRRSLSPLDPLAGVLQLWRLYKRERPDLVHHLTIKPVLYGTVAARIAEVPSVINTIPGLGHMFVGTGWRGWLKREFTILAYRTSLHFPNMRMIFQNPEDRDLFLSRGIVTRQNTRLIRGSGVDPNRFVPTHEAEGVPILLFASRLLWDKGLAELIEATRILKIMGIPFRTVLVGTPDANNPSAVPASILKDWTREGLVEWWGQRQDMPAVMHDACIVVLPSYREGVPRVLIEAAAAARPIIATDVPGCREVVRHGENGFLVPPRDPQALADAAEMLLGDPDLRARMGARGREIMVQDFSEEVVIRQTLDVYQELLAESWTQGN